MYGKPLSRYRRARSLAHALFLAALAVGLLAAPASAVDRVVLRRDGRQQQINGELLVTAQDGGLLILAPDGVLWTVPPDELVEHTTDESDFKPLAPEALGKRLLTDLPAGFQVHTTPHYVIVYNTSRAYAQWCGQLFEKLYRAFTSYWTKQGFELATPRFPLVAVVFADQPSYARFSTAELGDATNAIIGYYSLATNRMTMYDLTGIESLRAPGDRRGSTAQINAMLDRPEAERTVATVIHEATHQLAFNCGLQTRYSDIPLWVSEGIAVYFETPDLSNSKGWRNSGGINPARLAAYLEYAQRRPADSLRTLIADDARFRDTKKAIDAYAEAWVLSYFLIHQRPKQYRQYLLMLSEKKQLLWDDPQRRVDEFTTAFGDLDALDVQMQKYVNRLR
ncbi:MAG: DUF1570 domain-containing protein [Planctomycetia bacterium]|nr:DUF1570 domain-containing protein [Planctomycetia bacterium]